MAWSGFRVGRVWLRDPWPGVKGSEKYWGQRISPGLGLACVVGVASLWPWLPYWLRSLGSGRGLDLEWQWSSWGVVSGTGRGLSIWREIWTVGGATTNSN